MALPLNLLPAELRPSGARWLWIPSAALGAAVLLLAVALGLFPRYDTSRYLASLNAEIARVAPVAARSTALDHQIETTRRNTSQLDALRARTKSDMDVLAEMTRILPPPAWLNLLEITRTQVTLAGETPQAAPLLQAIDASPLFQGSEFVMPPARVANGEAFRIRTNREAGQ
jgi:general secretion pathway protein L